MPVHECQCGARYRFRDSAIGKRAKCKKCERVFTLEDHDAGPIAIAPDPPGAQVAHRGDPAAAAATVPVPPPNYDPSAVVIERAQPEEVPRTYVADLLRLPFLLSRFDNLMTFVAMWVLLAIASLLPDIIALALFAWYFIFLFGVISEAAGGEPTLPELTPSTDVWGDMVGALVKWVGSWFICMVPAFTTLSVAAWLGAPILDGANLLWTGNVFELLQAGMTTEEAVFVGSVALGTFMWPIVVLCIALGGFSTLGRLDLIVTTVVRTLPIYTWTVGLVFLAEFLDPVWHSFDETLWGRALAIGLVVYLDVIAMRAIGLYYHHFKHRFAWSWE